LNPTRWLSVAIFALCATVISVPAFAQSMPSQTGASVEIAGLMLPNAPVPQNSAQAPAQAGDKATPAPAPSSSSSSTGSQQSEPAGSPAADGQAAGDDAKKQQHDQAERDLKKEEQQRLLGVMPQFQVVMGGHAVPLTGGEKWRLALHSAIDPFYIGWAFVIGGGEGEATDSHPGYGWGPSGYFKRVGATYADNLNGALIGNALLPQLLHQDPRYFRLGQGKIFHRFLYAAGSTVICKGDNGKWQPNVSNVLGNFISGAISNAYYPAQERGVGLTLENGLDVTLVGALGGQLLEFGPDLARLVSKHKHPAAAVAPAPPATPDPAAGTR
jgi:hypothetical protein